ncbi:MAG: replicative DNA helicase, partial [Planctomycetes bacterium]|nr:replicative DNA helicase [Planctomycetota bacterium]
MATAHRADETHQRSGGGSEILDRLPPHNLDAEKGVLGSLLLDPQLCDDVALIVRPEDFYSDTATRLFATMRAMHDEGGRIDMTLLVERLKHDGQFDAIGGSAYLAEIVRAVPVAAHAEYYAEIVRDKALLRALIHTSTEILRDAYDPSVNPREIVNSAEQRIFAVHDQRSSDQLTSIHDALMEAFEQIDARMEHGAASGVPSGFTDLDNLTGGMHDSELVILAARPAMGKTALATNIADHVAVESNVATLFVSLEMSRLELSQRLLCARGKISGRKFRSDFLSGEDRKTLMKASGELSNSPLFIDDTPSRTMTEIAATSRRLKRRHNLGLVVIDYLQLIEPDNSRDPRQE